MSAVAGLILYGKTGCHLCEEARALLARETRELSLAEVDIAGDPLLLSRYGERIPVLARSDTGEELDWPFTGQEVAAFVGR